MDDDALMIDILEDVCLSREYMLGRFQAKRQKVE
jgi:hypothetical protein